jgi:serine/threonine protein kinase
MDFSAYEFSSLQEGQFTLHRGLSDRLEPILVVTCSDEYPSPGSLQRLEYEHALRADLDAEWAVRPVELVRHEGRLILVLEDPGGEPLERMLDRSMDVLQLLRIAVPLASVIGRMHAQGLIHKDLKPANILVDAAGGRVRLTGFGVASRLPRERQAPGPPEEIAGTLAYMAPSRPAA